MVAGFGSSLLWAGPTSILSAQFGQSVCYESTCPVKVRTDWLHLCEVHVSTFLLQLSSVFLHHACMFASLQKLVKLHEWLLNSVSPV